MRTGGGRPGFRPQPPKHTYIHKIDMNNTFLVPPRHFIHEFCSGVCMYKCVYEGVLGVGAVWVSFRCVELKLDNPTLCIILSLPGLIF